MNKEDMLGAVPYPALIINSERKVVMVNSLGADAGFEVGKFCWDTFGNLLSISEEDKAYFESTGNDPYKAIKCLFCKGDDALRTGEEVIVELPVGDDIYETHWNPISTDEYIHYAFKK